MENGPGHKIGNVRVEISLCSSAFRSGKFSGVARARAGGARWGLYRGLHAIKAECQSRKEQNPSKARSAAERILGPLNWRALRQVGCWLSNAESVAIVEIIDPRE